MRGNFIVFEGLDGSGKTSYMLALINKLQARGIACRSEREPTGSILGLIARDVIEKKLYLREETMALLFAADRLEHIENDILPHINNGVHVVCDRYFFSNLAYQSLTVPMARIVEYNRAAIERLVPDLTIFIDVDPEECVRRMNLSRTGVELYDEKGLLIRENYLRSFEMLKGAAEVRIIDGNRSKAEVMECIWKTVKPILHLE